MEQPDLLARLQELALAENWDAADALIDEGCRDEAVMTWAGSIGVSSPDYQLRDLAVSLFERSSDPLPPGIEGRLETLMHTDENQYVQFRAAFALFTHGVRTDDVVSMLRDALGDPDVAEIAKGYLDELNGSEGEVSDAGPLAY